MVMIFKFMISLMNGHSDCVCWALQT